MMHGPSSSPVFVMTYDSTRSPCQSSSSPRIAKTAGIDNRRGGDQSNKQDHRSHTQRLHIQSANTTTATYLSPLTIFTLTTKQQSSKYIVTVKWNWKYLMVHLNVINQQCSNRPQSNYPSPVCQWTADSEQEIDICLLEVNKGGTWHHLLPVEVSCRTPVGWTLETPCPCSGNDILQLWDQSNDGLCICDIQRC